MTPKIFELTIEVKQADLDELLHVNNVVYFTYLQEAAIGHWYKTVPVELSESLRWVVKKHEIEYFKAAVLNDKLTVNTWISAFSGLTCVRNYEIFCKDALLVKAQTQWVAMDPVSMKPKRLNVSELEKYFFE